MVEERGERQSKSSAKIGFELANTTDESKVYALQWALEKGHTDIIQVLILMNKGIRNVVNKKYRIGKTALYYASLYRCSKIAELF